LADFAFPGTSQHLQQKVRITMIQQMAEQLQQQLALPGMDQIAFCYLERPGDLLILECLQMPRG